MDKQNQRQQQATETRQRLYQAAIALMYRDGFDNVKVEQICRRARVSVGTFYHYFESKRGILIEIFREADRYFESDVKPALDQFKGSAIDRIGEYFRFYGRYDTKVGLDMTQQLYSPHMDMFITKGRYMQALLQEIIRKGQLDLELTAEFSAEIMCEDLFIAARGLAYDWTLHKASYDLEDRMANYMKRLASAYRR